MTQLLLHLFVKADPDQQSAAYHTQVGKLAGTTGILCNLLLFAGKMVAGILSGSIAIIADAVNNLSDAASSIVTLLGFHLAQRPADLDHPYGHARYEYLSGLVVAFMILLAGTELAESSFRKILFPEVIDTSVSVLCILVASILVKFWMSRYFHQLGERIHSGTLEATSADSRNDVVATSAVLVSCLISRFLHCNVDGITGLAVAIFVFWSGVKIVRETVTPLLGAQADKDLIDRITNLVMSHDQILGIHDLLIHDYGPGQCFASLHAEIAANMDMLQTHDILDDIECDVLRELNVHLVIHCDPIPVDNTAWIALRSQVRYILKSIDRRLSIHDLRLVEAEGETKLVFDLAVPYDSETDEAILLQTITPALAAAGIPYNTVIHFDRKA